MSGEMPLRPTSLEYNNNTKLTNVLGAPKRLTTSTTPTLGSSSNNIAATKIPTPSPGVLRRSVSLRIRGDRFSPATSSSAKLTVNNAAVCNGCGNALNNGNQRPFRSPTSDRHMGTPISFKSPGLSRKNPLKNTVQESPTRQRSLSLSLSNQALSPPHTPPVSPDRGFVQDDDDEDLDSLHSYSSLASTASCEHAYVARNGTTFSGRKMKYVVHCSSHAGQTGDEYLTPTQRAQRQIRRLKQLLQQAKLDLEQKDSDIFRLTKEVVELRLYKASLNSPESNSSNSDCGVMTVRENTPDQEPPPPPTTSLVLMQSGSCSDSGHFEEQPTKDQSTCTEPDLIKFYEMKLEEMMRKHNDLTQQLKEQHNEKVEQLLKSLSEVNERYCQMIPDYESAKERIKELECELDGVSSQLKNQEENHRRMYLKLYEEHKDVLDGTHCSTTAAAANGTVAKYDSAGSTSTTSNSIISRVSVQDLLHQLHVTQIELDNIKGICDSADLQAASAQSLLSAKEAVSLWVLGARKAMYRRLVEARGSKSDLDPEVTLQFLKSAIYYFLTDKENHRGHLRAIESILGFTSDEISNINRANIS